jgi:hypothetical protein
MSDTPAWLATGSDKAAPVGGDNFEMTTGVTASQPATPSGASTTTSGASAAAESPQEDLPKIILTMRLANMGVAIALIVCSVRITVIVQAQESSEIYRVSRTMVYVSHRLWN